MDDDDYIDEPVFQQSINAFAQAGFAPLGLGTLDVLGMNKKFDAKGHFKETVNAIAQQLREDRIKLSGNDLEQLIETVDILKEPQYKNPTAYLLGYIASEGGRDIQRNNVNNVFKNILKTVSDKSVKEEDVLRYTRLWYNLVREKRE
jgi:hypothetical protein